MIDHDKLRTAREIEVLEGINRRTLYDGAATGTIPAYRVGPKRGGVRFKLSEVLAALRVAPRPDRERISV